MKKYIYTLLAVASMALTACNENNIPTPAELPTPGEGRTVTITATTGDNPDTRISYQETEIGDDPYTNILWSEGDNFSLCYSGGDPEAAYLFKKEGSDESSTANFTCTNLPDNTQLGATLYAIYPGNSEIKAHRTNLAIDFSTQDGKATGKHLMLAKLESPTIDDWDGISFSFETNVALLKLTLKNEDFKGNDITNITVDATNLCGESVFEFEDQSWTDKTNGSITINAPITGDDEGNVTVYIAQPKSDESTGPISISATCGGNLYSGTLVEGTFEEYCVYTAEADMLPSMRFTVTTAEQNEFTLPFKDDTGDYTLTVDWGDSEITTIDSGTGIASIFLSHDYAVTDGTYTITLTTTAPYTEAQMPGWRFLENSSAPMLVSMDSPMLNTASTDFSSCFEDCSNLATIPDGLFAYNTTVIDFSACFNYCKNLALIPDGLFATNIATENFKRCFDSCSSLETIPAELFATNIDATNFSSCFGSCSSLETIPAELFAMNTVAEDFSDCFASCSNLATIPAELFAANKKATNFYECFAGCSNLETIPAELFAMNTIAENFNYCFRECTSLATIPAGLFAHSTCDDNYFYGCFERCSNLQLNSNIFCDESTEKSTRFAGKTVDFSYCFYEVGSNLKTNEGGTAPALWGYTFDNVDKLDCFFDCTNLTNYAYIPDTWK